MKQLTLAATLGLSLVLPCLTKADPATPASATTSTVWMVSYPGAAKDLNDFRLTELESELGILRWVWEMEVPAGKKLIVRFTSKDSTTAKFSHTNWVYEITGPLSRSFDHRLSLTSHLRGDFQPVGRPSATYGIEITTDKRGFTSQGSFPDEVLTLTGDRGGYDRVMASPPYTLLEMHFGHKDSPKEIDYKLTIDEAPADLGAEPGSSVSVDEK